MSAVFCQLILSDFIILYVLLLKHLLLKIDQCLKIILY